MAHNIEFNRMRGSFSFIAVKQPAWHNLGKVVQEAMTIKEAIQGANLDFKVGKVECYANTGIYDIHGELMNNRMINVPNTFATYRKDNGDILGAVGSSYEIIQNEEAFDFFNTFLGESDACFQTAGCLGNGETVFLTAKLPAHIKVTSTDIIDQYLLLSTSHDGSKSIQIMFTPIRVVCNNTLNAALNSGASKINIRHTKSAKAKIDEAHKLMGITNERTRFMNEAFPAMTRIKMTDEQVKNYIHTLFLSPAELTLLAERGIKNLYNIEAISTRKTNVIDDVYKTYFIGPGQQMDSAQGTAWGAYNAVTCYFNNVKTFKNDSDAMKSNFYGTNYDTMQKAFNLALVQ